MAEPKLTSFTNLSSKRIWGEEECRLMVNAALAKLIDDAGGRIDIRTEDLMKAARVKGRTLGMAMSDDDKVLTLTWLETAET